jgi:hypothetical protein
MKPQNLAKLNAIKEGTGYIKFYMFFYLYAFIVVILALMLDSAAGNEVWSDFIKTLKGGGLTFSFVYLAATIILFLTAVFNVSMLPLFNKTAYVATMIHQSALFAYRPVILSLTFIIYGKAQRDFLIATAILFPLEAVFSVFNVVYFAKRRELFYNDIVKLVTGEEKDTTKH